MLGSPDDGELSVTLREAVGRLTEHSRAALRRSLDAALGTAVAGEVLAADLVNTRAEPLDVEAAPAALPELIRRAWDEGAGAPMVRLEDGERYALLVSSEHLWRLADQVDEVELAVQVLSSALVGGLGSPAVAEALRAQLD